MLSLSCSVALIVLLHKYNSQPMPRWRHGITVRNCTWQPMSSLAVCSKCEDITSTSPVSCDLAFSAAPYTQNATGKLQLDFWAGSFLSISVGRGFGWMGPIPTYRV